jgi:hypothetical protein
MTLGRGSSQLRSPSSWAPPRVLAHGRAFLHHRPDECLAATVALLQVAGDDFDGIADIRGLVPTAVSIWMLGCPAGAVSSWMRSDPCSSPLKLTLSSSAG